MGILLLDARKSTLTMAKILLTGGSGFLGKALLEHSSFYNVISIGRTCPKNCFDHEFIELNSSNDYAKILQNIDVIVHAAGRAHVMKESAKNPRGAYREINTFATLNLAKQAADLGVKRFVFISTIKVLGEKTIGVNRFRHDDDPAPFDDYAISKNEAEIGLKELCSGSNMEFVIIRPPLIYGPGVKGNFASLMSIMSLPLPLPFARIQNKRSLVSLDNIVDLIAKCLEDPRAQNQTFLVSDDNDLSTSELFSLIAEAKGTKINLFKMPEGFLRTLFCILGMRSTYERLYTSMRVDISHTKKQLGWFPINHPRKAIQKCLEKNI